MFFTLELDLTARVLAKENPVASLYVGDYELAGLGYLPFANRHDLALLRLLLGGIGNDNPAFSLVFFLDAFHQDAIAQRSYFHRTGSLLASISGIAGYGRPRVRSRKLRGERPG